MHGTKSQTTAMKQSSYVVKIRIFCAILSKFTHFHSPIPILRTLFSVVMLSCIVHSILRDIPSLNCKNVIDLF